MPFLRHLSLILARVLTVYSVHHFHASAVSKAREAFEPFIHQLGTRLSHVLRRLLPPTVYLLQVRVYGRTLDKLLLPAACFFVCAGGATPLCVVLLPSRIYGEGAALQQTQAKECPCSGDDASQLTCY